MSQFNTNISVLADGKDLIDMALSNFIRRGFPVDIEKFKLRGVRDFFIRKVHFSAMVFDQKLSTAIDEFPNYNEVSSFYGDLCHILCPLEYARALSGIKVSRDTIKKMEKTCLSLMKKNNSVDGFKCVTIYALGLMCTVISQIAPRLVYLEEIRKHLVVFPCVDPNAEKIELVRYPRGGINAHILQWLDRVEQALGMRHLDGDLGTDGRDLNPEEQYALIWTRICKRMAESGNVTPYVIRFDMLSF